VIVKLAEVTAVPPAGTLMDTGRPEAFAGVTTLTAWFQPRVKYGTLTVVAVALLVEVNGVL
jgi:hypothetical protein